MFFLALRKYFVIWVSLLGASVIFLTSVLNHATLMQIVNNFLIGTGVTILLLGVVFYMNYKTDK
jgi:hypothetical protein